MINLDNGKIFYEKTNFPKQYIIHDWVAIGPGRCATWLRF